jgi:hypothetical protein
VKAPAITLITGSHNIDIGNLGVANESNTIRIGTADTHTATFVAGISGATVAGGVAVYVTPLGSARHAHLLEPFQERPRGYEYIQ